MEVTDLTAGEYGDYYSRYFQKIPKETTLVSGFKDREQLVVDFFKGIPESKLEYQYAEGKWTIKEVLQHLIDTERVFMYRCFCIARADKTNFPGYEQNDYVVPSAANAKSLDDILEEYKTVRQSFYFMLKSFRNEDLEQIGNASGFPLSARAAAFITLGHEIWHMDIIKERYL